MVTPDPQCPICAGSGMAQKTPNPPHPPVFSRCICVIKRGILANVEQGMTGLSKAPKIDSSPLRGKEKSNVWVTAPSSFLAHLRHVAVRQPSSWSFKVVSDAELVTAWLASVALKGADIIDPDAYMVSTKYLTIPDLVDPPDLLIIRMGVKVARNEAASEVLSEALNLRIHAGKPTWVWDEPLQPLNSAHLFWSKAVGQSLKEFERVSEAVLKGSVAGQTPATPNKRGTSSGGKQPPSKGKKRQKKNALGNGKKALRGGGS